MALNNQFYNEIFEKEEYWTDLNNKNLLNIYYLNGQEGLKQFYLIKKEELENEYALSHSEIIKSFITIIDSIINKIDVLTSDYRAGKNVDMKPLSKLFIVNQMNNKAERKKEDKDLSDIEKLQIKKQVLENIKKNISNQKKDTDDNYLYDDFPDQKAV